MKNIFRTIAIIGFFVIGTLVVSQYSDNLAPTEGESELSTQAAGLCSGTTCDRVLVDKVFLNTNGWLYVSTNAVEKNKLSCSPVANIYLRVKDDSTNYKEFYTLALAAKLSNTTITIKTTSDSVCTIDRMNIH